MERAYGTASMPETAENVAEAYQVSRADQDAYVLQSQQRAAKPRENGFFAEEITPVEAKDAKGKPFAFEKDEHLRPDTTLESLPS